MSGLHAFMNINISLHIEENIAYLQTLVIPDGSSADA